ncbi:MAG: tRNA (adenosine(37)-N6)-threonylcarbamoyltransferase complex dimerization subunit type 1 TsaB [Oscillospiraceae bacterium]|jgi:tRNA threonylcarbamoyladenosine biosynthesis protein TsaB|nr:tRNA (adenosine(37)-N6)-threonylcarbamoyltransferase complex dimerization subunit type 1 TsaB [Oscillospiraceae bacterium]
MLLAIDASSVTASAALARGGVLVSESFISNGLTHSQTLAPLIGAALKNAGASPSDVTRVAVTNGPGSFTGLRIGVATALGFAGALGIPCAGVSSLMAAAYGALEYEGTVCAAMDARRGQLYCAMFHMKQSVLTRVTEDCAMDYNSFVSQAPSPVLWVGDAASQCAREGDRIASRPYVSGYGAALCFLNGFTRPADSVIYLRPPQAERERMAKHPAAG